MSERGNNIRIGDISLTFMPGRPGCPVRLEGQALGHWKTQQPIWGHGRALPPGGSTESDPPNLLARAKGFLWSEMLKRSCCPISHQVLIWQQLRNFQIFELNTTITELWPKVPKIEISSHVVRWKKRLQSRYQQMIYEVFFSIFTSYKLFNVLVLKL